MNTQPTHVILGTGPLGMAAMRAAVARGKTVRVVSRSGSAVVPTGVENVRADLYNADEVRRVVEGASVVVQCAQPGYTEWVEKFPPLQASIVKGVMGSGARLVVGENLYGYGLVEGEIHEGLPFNAHTRKGTVRARMSEALMEAHANGLPVTMGRASDFFGPGVLGSSVGDRLFPNVLAGKGVAILGDLDAPHTVTFIDDFGRALITLGDRDEALGQAWHVPNAPTVTQRAFAELAYKLAGTTPKVSRMAPWMMRMAGLFMPEAKEVVEMTYEFDRPFVVSHRKYAECFGDDHTPLIDAISQTLAWYRTRK